MHHPEIYDIISIIEDYFLLSDTKFRCQIEPLVCIKQFGELSEDNPPKECKGIKIVRQLNNGRIEVNIFGCRKDNDSMDCQYFLDGRDTPEKVSESIFVYDGKYGEYSTENTRDWIREIIILDRELAKKQEVSLCST
ncbi:hypothetical protein [Chamaesiphon sp. VAR_69_metabat_338]|uniref:hypothetical protein n=1 Tax=Chamaesiphon sp. VAR_69_metabat_338 TaxID=2964704 RepID=UPI00286E796B|nr:hypothetical protein [Chamaesiphon sp. VAR_69_metabat_338]